MISVLDPWIDKGAELINLTKKGIDRIIQCSEIGQDGVNDKFQDNVVIQVYAVNMCLFKDVTLILKCYVFCMVAGCNCMDTSKLISSKVKFSGAKRMT